MAQLIAKEVQHCLENGDEEVNNHFFCSCVTKNTEPIIVHIYMSSRQHCLCVKAIPNDEYVSNNIAEQQSSLAGGQNDLKVTGCVKEPV